MFKKEGYKIFIIRLKVPERVYEQRIIHKLGRLDDNYINRIDDWKKQYKEFGERVKPDIIIMDYRMPVLDGLVAMKEILKKTPDAKVLFVSAEKRVEKEAFEAGAIGFFTKPTSIRTLLAEIDRIQQLQTEVLIKENHEE